MSDIHYPDPPFTYNGVPFTHEGLYPTTRDLIEPLADLLGIDATETPHDWTAECDLIDGEGNRVATMALHRCGIAVTDIADGRSWEYNGRRRGLVLSQWVLGRATGPVTPTPAEAAEVVRRRLDEAGLRIAA